MFVGLFVCLFVFLENGKNSLFWSKLLVQTKKNNVEKMLKSLENHVKTQL